MLTRCLYAALWPFKQNHLKNVLQDIFLAAKVWNGADSAERYPNIMTAYYNFSLFSVFVFRPLHVSLWHFGRWTDLLCSSKYTQRQWLTGVRVIMRCTSFPVSVSTGVSTAQQQLWVCEQCHRLCLVLSHSIQQNKCWTCFFKGHMSSEHSWTFPETRLYLSNKLSQDLAT